MVVRTPELDRAVVGINGGVEREDKECSGEREKIRSVVERDREEKECSVERG